jgi:hypothetical protein
MNSLKRHLHRSQFANMARDGSDVFLALGAGFARLRYLACLLWTLRSSAQDGTANFEVDRRGACGAASGGQRFFPWRRAVYLHIALEGCEVEGRISSQRWRY